MIRQARRHTWCTWLPLGLNQTGTGRLRRWQETAQTLMGTRKVVKGLKEDHTAAQLLAVFAEPQRFPRERSEGMTQGQIDAFNQTGADLQA